MKSEGISFVLKQNFCFPLSCLPHVLCGRFWCSFCPSRLFHLIAAAWIFFNVFISENLNWNWNLRRAHTTQHNADEQFPAQISLFLYKYSYHQLSMMVGGHFVLCHISSWDIFGLGLENVKGLLYPSTLLYHVSLWYLGAETRWSAQKSMYE